MVSEEGDRFREVILPCLKYMNYFIVNEVEAGACFGRSLRDAQGEILLDEVEAAARFLLAEGVNDAVVIHFPEGGFGMMASGEKCFEPSFRVPASEIVSSVGAGDAFCAGMLYSLYREFDPEYSLRVASAAAGCNLTEKNSIDGLRRFDKMMEFESEIGYPEV